MALIFNEFAGFNTGLTFNILEQLQFYLNYIISADICCTCKEKQTKLLSIFDSMLLVQCSLQFLWFLCSLMAFGSTLGLLCYRGSGVDLKNFRVRDVVHCPNGRCRWLIYMKSSHIRSEAGCVRPQRCNEETECSLSGRTECSLTCCNTNFCNYEGKYEVIENVHAYITIDWSRGKKVKY